MNKHHTYDLLIPKMIDAANFFKGKMGMDSIAKLCHRIINLNSQI